MPKMHNYQANSGDTVHPDTTIAPALGDDLQLLCGAYSWSGYSRPSHHRARNLFLAGELVEHWLLSQNASILNDCTATCVNRGTGGLSTAYITAASNAWSTGTEWVVGEDLGSDHLPITPSTRCEVPAALVSHHRAPITDHQQCRLEPILRCRRRSNRAILDSPYVTR